MLWTLVACIADCPAGFDASDDGTCTPESEESAAPRGWEPGEPPTAEQIQELLVAVAAAGLPNAHQVVERQLAWFELAEPACPGGGALGWMSDGCLTSAGDHFLGKNGLTALSDQDHAEYFGLTAGTIEASTGSLRTGGELRWRYTPPDQGYDLEVWVNGDFLEEPARYAWMGQDRGHGLVWSSLDSERMLLTGAVGHAAGSLFLDEVVLDRAGCLDGPGYAQVVGNAPWVALDFSCDCAASELGEICAPELGLAAAVTWAELELAPELPLDNWP